jgi:membrane protease YdiL (CAAX protease family)
VSGDLFENIESTPKLELNGGLEADSGNFDEPPVPEFPVEGPSWPWWLGILLMSGLLAGLGFLSSLGPAGKATRGAINLQLRDAGQKIVAARENVTIRDAFSSVGGADPFAEETARSVNFGPIEARLGHTILVREVLGPEAAGQALNDVLDEARRKNYELDEEQQRIASELAKWYRPGQDAIPVESLAESREFLEERLGWVTRLLVHPFGDTSEGRKRIIDESVTAFWKQIIAVGAGMVLLLVGVLVAGIMGKLATDTLVSRVKPETHSGPVYLETFALWFALWIGVQLAAGFAGAPIEGIVILMFLSVAVSFVWPRHRGLDMSRIRKDIGLDRANPFKEVFFGIIFYVAMLPFIAVGLIVTLVLAGILGALSQQDEYSSGGISHPLSDQLINGGGQLFFIFLAAAVAAPVCEEIVFRGFLYRYLRNSTRRMPGWVSVLFASLFNGFLFAIVHPQGIAAVPVLMVIGAGFCLCRQWRGSLIAPMAMHAIHNGMSLLLVTQLFT